MVNLKWSIITFASSVRIILTLLVRLGSIEHFLPLLFFVARSAFAKTSTSYSTRLPKTLCPRVSLRPFSERVSKTLSHLKTSFGIGLDEIVSTNRRKYSIEPLTLNIFNPSLWSLMLLELSENLLLFKSSEIVSSLQLPLRENNGRENNSWEELVEKAIEAEAKFSFLPSLFIRNMDQRYP